MSDPQMSTGEAGRGTTEHTTPRRPKARNLGLNSGSTRLKNLLRLVNEYAYAYSYVNMSLLCTVHNLQTLGRCGPTAPCVFILCTGFTFRQLHT
jgi:hypothetical protein